MDRLIQAQKDVLAYLNVPPRFFVFHCCAFLDQQRLAQREVTAAEMREFVQSHQLPDYEDEGQPAA